MSTSDNTFLTENCDSDGDSETNDNSDDYYQPISAVDDEEEEEEDDDTSPTGDSIPPRSNTNNLPHGQDLCNGYPHSQDLKDEEESEEEEIGVGASELEIWRAFREDESRRNAPLPRENATRIMDAMRGISLRGFTPDWANQVPENQWIDQLARLRRQPPPSSAAGITQNRAVFG